MVEHDGSDGFLAGVARAPALVGRALVRAYQYSLAGLIGFDCRHLPTCSAYADEAIDRFGLWAGGWMTLARLCRCRQRVSAGRKKPGRRHMRARMRRRTVGAC